MQGGRRADSGMVKDNGRKYLLDAALGCLLGACAGDAAGAVLEMLGRKPRAEEVERAMSMPGGGPLGVAPGQITDDGELMICLARALRDSDSFPIERIARNYSEWVRSVPFDMGRATRRSIGCRKDILEVASKGYSGVMAEAAHWNNMKSKANGSLMRAAPTGIWGHRLDDDELAACARRDSSLSHPNESCLGAVSCYVIAIAHLMRERGDRVGAFEHAEKWAAGNANSEVRGWLKDARENKRIPYYPLAGFVRIGFTHAFRHLLLGTPYEDAIRETLSGGGDTDTNACIVGGLLGAAYGAESIPLHMRNAVLDCDTSAGDNPRPEFLHPSQIPRLAEDLIG